MCTSTNLTLNSMGDPHTSTATCLLTDCTDLQYSLFLNIRNNFALSISPTSRQVSYNLFHTIYPI